MPYFCLWDVGSQSLLSRLCELPQRTDPGIIDVGRDNFFRFRAFSFVKSMPSVSSNSPGVGYTDSTFAFEVGLFLPFPLFRVDMLAQVIWAAVSLAELGFALYILGEIPDGSPHRASAGWLTFATLLNLGGYAITLTSGVYGFKSLNVSEFTGAGLAVCNTLLIVLALIFVVYVVLRDIHVRIASIQEGCQLFLTVKGWIEFFLLFAAAGLLVARSGLLGESYALIASPSSTNPFTLEKKLKCVPVIEQYQKSSSSIHC